MPTVHRTIPRQFMSFEAGKGTSSIFDPSGGKICAMIAAVSSRLARSATDREGYIMGSNETYEVFALRYAESIDRMRGDNFKVTDDHDAPMPRTPRISLRISLAGRPFPFAGPRNRRRRGSYGGDPDYLSSARHVAAGSGLPLKRLFARRCSITMLMKMCRVDRGTGP
jgi:hypothetical protein